MRNNEYSLEDIALTLYWALFSQITSLQEVVTWADRIVEIEEVPPLWILEISTSFRDRNRALEWLHEASYDGDFKISYGLFLVLVAGYLRGQDSNQNLALRALSQFGHVEFEISMDEFGAVMFLEGDAEVLDLNKEQVIEDIVEAANPYRSIAETAGLVIEST